MRTETHYLRERSPSAARHFLDSIRQARKNLGDFPMMGPPLEDSLILRTRRLVVGQYVLTYAVSDRVIDVLAIRHGRMKEVDLEIDENFDYEA